MTTVSPPLLSTELNAFAFLAATNSQSPVAHIAIFDPSNGFYMDTYYGLEDDLDMETCTRALAEQVQQGYFEGDPSELPGFQDHPKLQELQFAAAFPLQLKQKSLKGVLCIMDSHSRILMDEQRQALEVLCDLVGKQFNAKQSVEQMQRLEDRVREATRIGRLGYWELQIDGFELNWSEEVYKIFGLDPEEFHPTHNAFFGLVHPEELGLFIDQQTRIVKGELEEMDIQHRIVLKDGTVKWVHERGYLTRDEQGKPKTFQGTVQEITQQKDAEKRMQVNKEFINSTLDNIPLGVVVNRISDGKLTYVNPYFQNLFGYSLQEMDNIHQAISLVLPDPAVREQRMEQVEQYLGSGTTTIMEWKEIETYDRHGKRRLVNINTIPLYDQDLVISTLADETDSLEAKKAVETSNERFQLVSKATWDTIYDWDIQENTLVWGENYQRTLGNEPIEDPAKNFENWETRIHPDDRERVSRSLDQALQGKARNWASFYRFRHAESGEYLRLQDRGLIIRDEQDRAIRMVGAVQDVTAEYLKESQLKILESAIENTKDAVLITEVTPGVAPADYPICYCNKAYEKLSGYHRSELIGETPHILHGPLTDPSVVMEAVQNLDQTEAADIDLVNYKKNGEPYWVNLSISPVLNHRNEITHYISIQREIGMRKAEQLNRDLIQKIAQVFSQGESLEETLKQTIRSIGKTLPISAAEIRLVDEQSKTLQLVESYVKYPELQDLVSGDIGIDYLAGEGLHGKIFKEVSNVGINNLQEAESGFLKYPLARKLGISAAYGIPLLTNKKIVGTLIVYSKHTSRDYNRIMDRRMQDLAYYLGTEINRKQLLEQLELIFASVPDLICTADSNGFIKKVNKSATEQFGYQPEEVIGHHFSEFVYPPDLETAIAEFQNVLQGKPTPYFEIRYMHKNREPRWLAWSINVPDAGGDIFCVAKDIDEKKIIEKELLVLNEELREKNEKLALSNTELEHFAYVASHDLQEPLRMISGFLTQLNKKYEDVLDEKGRTYIHYAVDGAKRMRSIIMDLLEYSRLGRSEEIKQIVDVNEVIQQIESMYGILLSKTGAKIERPDDLPTLYTYQVLLFQVFQNLIDNALKYRSEEREPRISIRFEELEEHYKFYVKDNGIGIDPEYFDKIFVIFQRLHTKAEYSGTGMGLTTAKKILEVLGGTIGLNSTPGEGTEFWFTVKKEDPKA